MRTLVVVIAFLLTGFCFEFSALGCAMEIAGYGDGDYSAKRPTFLPLPDRLMRFVRRFGVSAPQMTSMTPSDRLIANMLEHARTVVAHDKSVDEALRELMQGYYYQSIVEERERAKSKLRSTELGIQLSDLMEEETVDRHSLEYDWAVHEVEEMAQADVLDFVAAEASNYRARNIRTFVYAEEFMQIVRQKMDLFERVLDEDSYIADEFLYLNVAWFSQLSRLYDSPGPDRMKQGSRLHEYFKRLVGLSGRAQERIIGFVP